MGGGGGGSPKAGSASDGGFTNWFESFGEKPRRLRTSEIRTAAKVSVQLRWAWPNNNASSENHEGIKHNHVGDMESCRDTIMKCGKSRSEVVTASQCLRQLHKPPHPHLSRISTSARSCDLSLYLLHATSGDKANARRGRRRVQSEYWYITSNTRKQKRRLTCNAEWLLHLAWTMQCNATLQGITTCSSQNVTHSHLQNDCLLADDWP